MIKDPIVLVDSAIHHLLTLDDVIYKVTNVGIPFHAVFTIQSFIWILKLVDGRTSNETRFCTTFVMNVARTTAGSQIDCISLDKLGVLLHLSLITSNLLVVLTS